MNFPNFICPTNRLLERLDELLCDYLARHPDAGLTFAVYDDELAREDGDPLYFDADPKQSILDLTTEAHSYLISNVCAELRLDDTAVFLADDNDECFCIDGLLLLGITDADKDLIIEHKVRI